MLSNAEPRDVGTMSIFLKEKSQYMSQVSGQTLTNRVVPFLCLFHHTRPSHLSVRTLHFYLFCPNLLNFPPPVMLMIKDVIIIKAICNLICHFLKR